MTEARPTTVGFVGLGNMGFPMVTNLVEAGFTVRGFDVAAAAVEKITTVGAAGSATAAESATGADVLILMLPNSRIVQSVVDDLLAASALSESTVVVDMSSSEPVATQELAGRLAELGIALIDAPVSGGVRGAENGTLAIMAGGEDAAFERVEAVLAALGKVTRTGPVGSGHAVKAFNNLLSATHLWVTSEVMEAGKRFGLDPEVMLSVFNSSSGRSGSTENKWPNFILGETYNSGFGLALMLKDMKIALALAETTGALHQLSADAVERWSLAAADLSPTADHTEVARWIAETDPAVDPLVKPEED
jgi:3-hydroxyisobutyrate dehydrogenase